MTAIDLPYYDAAQSGRIIADLQSAMGKDGYLAFAGGLFKIERYSPAQDDSRNPWRLPWVS